MANGHAQWGDWLSPLRVFQYITFRGAGAAVTALVLCWLLGPMVIRWLKRIGVRQEYQDRARKDGKMTDGVSKRGVPTMGGLLIVGVIDLSALLWAQWNPLVTLTLLSMLVLCLLGFYDDYSKITRQNSDGLTEKVKLVVQFVLSATIAVYLWRLEETRQLITDVMVPFLKDPILSGPSATMVISWAAVMGVIITVCAIMGSSNAVNFTDGLDGLAVGSVLIVSMVFYVFTYIAGHAELARELYVPAVSGAGELSVVCAGMMGACLGFLWFNCFPARVFMGDTGSLALGGSLGIETFKGVHSAISGPYYLSGAELTLVSRVGADTVGMSTIPETIAAVHGGMRVLGISCVTDMAIPGEVAPLDHAHVVEVANRTRPTFIKLVCGIIEALDV